MNFGDNNELDDRRLTYIYNELVKSYKFKQDTWASMMKTPEFNVSKFKSQSIIC